MADPLLFQPFALRDVEFRNRLWIPPMCQYSASAEDGMPTDWHLQHYGSLARGGAGLVIVEASAVAPEGRISPRDLGIWSDEHGDALARVARAIRGHGARAAVQLAHAGRKASTHPALPGFATGTIEAGSGGWQTVAPSDAAFGDFAAPRALGADELPGVARSFVDAATRAVAAGFDAVEVHAAHGYLLHEFLSPLSNLRDDEYGGDLEGRSRLLREVVRGIRAAHPALPLLVRVSATEWTPDGLDVDEVEALVPLLQADGADFIDVSSAGNLPAPPPSIGPGYQVGLAARLRRGPLPVGAVGLITQAAQAESILATGQADVVLTGRAALSDPHLPVRWAHELRAPSAASLVPPQYARARF